MKFTNDANGQYMYGDSKMLVQFIRGGMVVKTNPRYKGRDGSINLFEPALVKDYYPGLTGVVVAVPMGDEIRFGYSRVHLDMDHFDKKKGVEIALGRALYNNINLENFHEYRLEICDALVCMHYRAKNYYRYLNKD